MHHLGLAAGAYISLNARAQLGGTTIPVHACSLPVQNLEQVPVAGRR